MLELIKNRRSIRRFTDEKISEEDKMSILKAGLLAPAGRGVKTVRFIVVEDAEKIKDLVNCKAHSTSPFLSATLAIIVLADSQKTDTWIEEASIATTFMQLEITNLGLGSTWIQMRNRTNKENENSIDALRARYNFPQNLEPLCVLAIGHKNENIDPYTDADCNLSMIHQEKF